MRTSTAIGVPLTLLQLLATRHTGVPIDPALALHNFAIATAVYGSDRAAGPLWSSERRASQLCALGVASWYASDPYTACLAPAVLALHAGYTPAKPLLAPIKPFFVAWWWSALVFAVPALHAHAEVGVDATPAAAFYLSVASLSHACDVVDAPEDAAAGLHTPAVALGSEAAGFAVACALSAWLLDQASAAPCMPYDATTLCAAYGLSFNQTTASGLALAGALATYTAANDLFIVDALLASSQFAHEASLRAISASIGVAHGLEEPYKKALIDGVFTIAAQGDSFGHALLVQYERLARLRL